MTERNFQQNSFSLHKVTLKIDLLILKHEKKKKINTNKNRNRLQFGHFISLIKIDDINWFLYSKKK